MDYASAQKILLCLPYGIGDVVMQTPVLETLRSLLPQANITGLWARPAIQLLERDPRLNRLFCVQDWGFRHWGDCGDSEKRRNFGAWLEEEKFEAVLDISHAVVGTRQIIWEKENSIFDSCKQTEERALQNGSGGVAAIKESIHAGLGFEVPPDLLPSLQLETSEREFVEDFLRDTDMQNRPLVGISPVASLALKRWPEERLASVADSLIEEDGCRIMLFRGPQQDSAGEVLNHMRRSDEVTTMGTVHLRRVAALLARCSAFVCNDTGLMHMAAAVGTPVVAVFGPTAPQIYLPPGEISKAVGGWDIDCPYRRLTSLGPPACWADDRCMIAEQSCICKVEVGQVLSSIRNFLR